MKAPFLASFKNAPFRPLSAKEQEVLEAIWDGLSVKNIAFKMQISTHTVETHLTNIHRKFRVHTSIQACRVGLQLGYLEQQKRRK